MFREPREPIAPVKNSETRKGAVILPNAFCFEVLAEDSKERQAAIQAHVDRCIECGLELTSHPTAANSTDSDLVWTCLENKSVPIPTSKSGSGDILRKDITIRVESAKVAGSTDETILGIRHTADIDGISASYVFDVYNRLNYTDAIDPYTYLVETVELLSTDSYPSSSKPLEWIHVAYTADRIAPFFSVRDFVTLDFVSRQHMLLCSRSCTHPKRPKTPIPTLCCSSSLTYRAPLMYFLRILPKPSGNGCTLVQFQYSDVGGIVPPLNQNKAVVKFGLESIPKIVGIALEAQRKKLPEVGDESSNEYLTNPLLPSWKQPVSEMLPGL